MSCGEIRKKTIIEVFNEMEYEEKVDEHNVQDSLGTAKTDFDYKVNSNELILSETKSFDNALNAAVTAQKNWKSSTAIQRADSLHKIWKVLREFFSSSPNLMKFPSFVDYLDFYTDLTAQADEYQQWRPHGVVLVVLNEYPYFVLGATVPAALAAGCSVIVLVPDTLKFLPLFLQEKIQKSGLQEGLFNVVTDFNINDVMASNKINKVFFCGSYLSAQKLYTRSLCQSFSFISLNNTAAFILESCDVNAAVDKIVTQTWGKNSLFAVTNVVVQESVHKLFLQKLKHRIEQLIMENINLPTLRSKIISEKINKVVSEAVRAGATIEKCTKYENVIEWSPTIIVNYQNQNIDVDVPILKVLLCRTAKEGVSLLNNFRHALGTSVWSEISSQALEISSMLNCPNVWINCHGVYEPSVPLQPSGISGDCVIGGRDGMLEFMSFRTDNPVEKYKSNDDEKPHDKIDTLQMAKSAHEAFKKWRRVNRRKYLKDIANALEESKELSQGSGVISHYAYFGNTFSFSENNSTQEFLVVRNKIPIGVILLIVSTKNIDATNLNVIITPAIALGNAVIVVLKESPSVELLIKNFNKFLPKNVLNVIVGINNGIQLASDPNIQAIWIHDESTVSGKYLETLKTYSAKGLKHIWIIPKCVTMSQHIFQKECLRNKVVWLTKVDQFP